MQAAQARTGNHYSVRCRPLLDRASVWRILFQGVVNAVLVVVIHVIAEQAPEMLFVQRDHLVQDLAAATPHPSFRNTVLPRRLDARSLGLQTGSLQERHDVAVKFRVSVEENVAIWGGLGKRFA